MNISETSFKTKNKIFYGFLLLASDLFFSAVSCFLAYYLRFFTKFFGSNKPTYLIDKNYIFYSIIFISVVAIVSLAFRLYFWDNIYKKRNYYLRVIITPFLSFIIVLIYGGLFKRFPFARLWILSLFVLSMLFLFLSRLLIGTVTKRIFVKIGIPVNGLTFGIEEDLAAWKKSRREGISDTVGKTSSERITSIDALRGFDMLWILGASKLVIALLAFSKSNWALRLAAEFDHTAWNGFTFYDLIFPLFLFIVGLVIPFSLAKYREGNINFKNAYIRIITRTIVLFFLGLIANGLLDFNFASMRWSGVLQRIAICYFFAAIIVLHIPSRLQPMVIGIILAAILFGYWAIMKFVPVPGFGAGNLTPEGNIAGYLDRLIIPGRLYYNFGESEGILNTIPAVGTTLLGALTGSMMRSNKTKIFKIKWIFISGVASLALGFAWNFVFPVNKILWTSSFVLFAGGFSLLLLGLFYWLIDYKGYKRWAFPFVVIGMNSITIYFVAYIFDFGIIVNIFVHGFINYMGAAKDAFFYFCLIAVRWLFLYFLYKKKIFFKV
jgi:predicted acyltransferase